MSVGIVRVQKFSAGSVKGIEIHDCREKADEQISHTNKDIDWSRTAQNYDLAPEHNQNFGRAVKKRIGQLQLTRAVRKDAVVMAQVLVTSDSSFFGGLTADQQKQFFQDSYDFLAARYGADNVIGATVHLDERTPHMHFNFVPVTEDGRLSAKSILTRQSLLQQQDDFAEQVGKKYGLERGMTKAERIEKGVQRKNLTMPEYKAAMQQIHALQAKAESALRMAQEASLKEVEARTRLTAVKAELKALTALTGQMARVAESEHDFNEHHEYYEKVEKREKAFGEKKTFLLIPKDTWERNRVTWTGIDTLSGKFLENDIKRSMEPYEKLKEETVGQVEYWKEQYSKADSRFGYNFQREHKEMQKEIPHLKAEIKALQMRMQQQHDEQQAVLDAMPKEAAQQFLITQQALRQREQEREAAEQSRERSRRSGFDMER